MNITQGDVFWAVLPAPVGSEAGYRRPVVVVQGEIFNQSELRTVVCVPLTTHMRRAKAQGNVVLRADSTGLPDDSVASVPHIVAVNKSRLVERVGRISAAEIEELLHGIDVLVGRFVQ